MSIRAPSRAEPLKQHLFVSCLDILPFLFEFVKMIGKYKYELYTSWLGAERELALFLFFSDVGGGLKAVCALRSNRTLPKKKRLM